MSDPEPAITADESRELLDAAARDLARARQELDARPRGERGTVTEEAALLIAMAQAKAILSIAAQLVDSAGLSPKAREGILAIQGAASDLRQAANSLRGFGR